MLKRDFLFELGCEELPPKALPKLAQSLHDSVASTFRALELEFAKSEWFATPRRLAIRFSQLDAAQADKQVEKLGPAVAAAFDSEGNPKPAASGFARSCGVTVDQLNRKVTDKGERLAYLAEVKGQQTQALLQEILAKAVSQLPVPKAMRWGNSSHQFSRPVHWILAIMDDQPVPVSLMGIDSGRQTFGHRFHAPQAIVIEKASLYEAVLREAKVIANFDERKQSIRLQTEALAQSQNAVAVIDDELLAEVNALVEWPVALLGKFDEAFLQVPSEALVSSMAEHQKYFHLTDSDGKLLANFITIANIESNNPNSVIEGNEKVIRPRLADAKFFYDTDNKKSLASYTEKLKTVVFQNKLGTLYDKSIRIVALGKVIANSLSANLELVEKAAAICKCDLMTDMVYEFPDLQGIMGRYYATNDGEPAEVAVAMDEIYMPRFAGDQLPETQTGLILALSERIDTLVGIFGIGQIPTGAKDPFALRRASVGVLRLITEKSLSLDLAKLIDASIATFKEVEIGAETKSRLLEYFAARSTAMYQETGIATQVINAVQELCVTQPLDFSRRVKAVAAFSKTEASDDLAEANKRVKNILAKSDFDPAAIKIDESLFETEEAALFKTIDDVSGFVSQQVASGNYEEALTKLAGLKGVVNNFFDNVMVNADDPKLKNNRLALITQLRNLFLGIADISLLQK